MTVPAPTPIRDDLPPEPPAAELTEAIVYEPDGRITIRWPGVEVSLRRPHFGEYREFLEADQRARPKQVNPATIDTQERLAEIITAWQSAARGENDSAEGLDADELLTLAAQLHSQGLAEQMAARSRNLAWWRLVCNGDPSMDPPLRGLASVPFPESDDDCPLWLSQDQPAIDAIGHWLSVPSVAPGS